MPGIVLDANLLVLFVVGVVRPDEIGKHRRVKEYRPEDFALLVETLRTAAQGIILTPNTLTEASNLLSHFDGSLLTEIRRAFKWVVEGCQEQVVLSRDAVVGAHFFRLGLTDESVIQLLARGPYSLLTADFDLYLAALSVGADAVNFNHLRARAGLA